LTIVLRKLLAMMSRDFRRRFYIIEIHALLSAFVDTCAFALLYPLLNIFTASKASTNTFAVRTARSLFGTNSAGKLELYLGIVIIVVFILSSIVGLTLARRQASFVSDLEQDLSSHMFERYVSMPYVDHISTNSSELIRNCHTLPVDATSNGTLAILGLTQNALTIGFLTCFIAVVDPIVVASAIAYFAITMYLYSRVASPRTVAAGRNIVRLTGQCVRELQEGFGGLKAFQSSNATRPVIAQYQADRRRLAAERYRGIVFTLLPQYYLQSVMIGGIVLFVGVVIAMHTRNVTALIGIIIAAMFRLLPALYGSLNNATRFRNAQGSIEEMYRELLRVDGEGSGRRRRATFRQFDRRESVSSLEVESAGAGRLLWKDRIELRNITFRYPKSDRLAVDGMSAVVERGAFVGIVGASGAGKTTVVDMLLGLFLPESGEIVIDDEPLNESNLGQWRNCVGYVPQEVFLIDGSVRDNIVFGGDAAVDDARIWTAIANAQLYDEVTRMDDGLEAKLGERGVRLSGGQRQRIGIARALYRNPDVLILDEATAALDVTTEAGITNTVESLGRTLTRIVVAHRLSTVKKCDRLLLLEEGHVIASGRFDELEADSALFRTMAHLARID
jgi:ABC-type multidrug transport system fused ATPase/permease subunit